MKALLCALFITLIHAAPSTAWIKKEVRTEPVEYDLIVVRIPFFGWLFTTYRDHGYAMPHPGTTFAFADFFDAVDPATDTPQQGDFVRFHVGADSEPHYGIIIYWGDDTAMVIRPVNVESTISISVPLDQIDWLMRPHKIKGVSI